MACENQELAIKMLRTAYGDAPFITIKDDMTKLDFTGKWRGYNKPVVLYFFRDKLVGFDVCYAEEDQ